MARPRLTRVRVTRCSQLWLPWTAAMSHRQHGTVTVSSRSRMCTVDVGLSCPLHPLPIKVQNKVRLLQPALFWNHQGHAMQMSHRSGSLAASLSQMSHRSASLAASLSSRRLLRAKARSSSRLRIGTSLLERAFDDVDLWSEIVRFLLPHEVVRLSRVCKQTSQCTNTSWATWCFRCNEQAVSLACAPSPGKDWTFERHAASLSNHPSDPCKFAGSRCSRCSRKHLRQKLPFCLLLSCLQAPSERMARRAVHFAIRYLFRLRQRRARRFFSSDARCLS